MAETPNKEDKNMNHTGPGDNVGRDKITNNYNQENSQPPLEGTTLKNALQALKKQSYIRFNRFIKGRFRIINKEVDANLFPPISLGAPAQDGLIKKMYRLPETNCSHAFLIGVGGMGKTVYLYQLWKQLLEDREDLDFIPIYIPLQEFNNAPEAYFIANYLKAQYGVSNIYSLLKSEHLRNTTNPNITLLLDGLNEVVDKSKIDLLFREINQFFVRENYPNLQLLITARSDIRKPKWKQAHLVKTYPLTATQIEKFLGNEVPNNTSLKDLLGNPMMLSMYGEKCKFLEQYGTDSGIITDISCTGEILLNAVLINKEKLKIHYQEDERASWLRFFVLEHFLPYLAWTMYQHKLFVIKKMVYLLHLS